MFTPKKFVIWQKREIHEQKFINFHTYLLLQAY